MNGKAFRDWIFILLILFIAIYLVVFINGNSAKCAVNPIPYGIKQIEKSSSSSVQCSCDVIGASGYYVLKANSTDLWLSNQKYRSIFGD